uniref:Uncharacterized protein n=1 Tax=Rhizophora mucronata TaxID=61149 RepID=A0A2P2QZ99_RHIMU
MHSDKALVSEKSDMCLEGLEIE